MESATREDLEKLEKEVEKELQNHRNNCPLIHYKEAIDSQFNSKVKDFDNEIRNVHGKVERVDKELNEKIGGVKRLLKIAATFAVMIFIFAGGVIGTLQTIKIGRAEFQNYLVANNERLDKVDKKFTSFIEMYRKDQTKRADKLETLLQRQSEFNTEVIKQTGILSKNLGILQVQVKENTKDLHGR